MTAASEAKSESALSPFVVSLSLTRKVPRRFCGFKRSLSESRRVIFPKYHLPKSVKEKERSEETPAELLKRTGRAQHIKNAVRII